MTAWIAGQPVSVEEAVGAAARLLAGARNPIVGGLEADVDAIRAAYRLAFKLGASLDANGSEALYADLAALAGSGAMMTTEAEARARADLVLAVGEGAANAPATAAIMAGPSGRIAQGHRRQLIVLAAKAPAAAAESRILHVPIAAKDLAATLGLIRALVGGRIAATAAAQGLGEVAEHLKQAAFGVAVYDPAELGDLGVEMLHGLVKDLNAATRFSTLSLLRAGRAALQVGAWTTGDGPRTGLGRAYPEHDPWRFDAARLIASGEAGAGLWVGSLAPSAWPAHLPAAALLGAAGGSEAEIVIEVARPGETAAGTIWHEGRATLVHQAASKRSDAPTAAAILAAIEAAIPTSQVQPC